MPDDPARDGFIFDGWHTAVGGGVLFTADTPVTGNITVYALWRFTAIAIPDANDDTLLAALAWINSNAVEGGSYAITVKNDAFSGCHELTSLTVRAVEPPDMLVEDWYTGDRLPTNLLAIYVPADSVDAYKAADGWKEHADIITAITP